MNDALEDKFADHQAASYVRRLASQIGGDDQQRAGINLIADKVDENSSQMYTFAVSMSEEPDLLSQWRAYTPDGGYSVGFFFESMKEIASQNGFTLAKCVYRPEERGVLIADKIDSYLNPIQNWVVSEQEGAAIANHVVSLSSHCVLFSNTSHLQRRENGESTDTLQQMIQGVVGGRRERMFIRT